MLGDLPLQLARIGTARPRRRQPQIGGIDVSEVRCHGAKILDLTQREKTRGPCRRSGIGRAAGLPLARLKTGVSQPDAILLYEKAGYRRRGPFGSYSEGPLNFFMEKALAEVNNQAE